MILPLNWNMSDPLSILWADDQPNVSQTFAALINEIGARVTHATDGTAALDCLRTGPFDVLITDLKMPPGEWGGLWLLEQMQLAKIRVPTLVLSGEGTQIETIKAIRSGADDYVTKDLADSELVQRVRELAEKLGPPASLLRLIRGGENSTFECKETLRWNIQAQRIDKNLEYSAMKTLAAFLNSQGGTLVIGVKDNGEVTGLERDGFETRDKALLHFDNLVKAALGDTVTQFLRVTFVPVDEREVLRIDCRPSLVPVYLKGQTGGELEFYIRRTASSVKLRLDEVVSYVQAHFR